MQPRCAQPPENTLPGSIPKPLRHGYLYITCSRLPAIFALFPVLSIRVARFALRKVKLRRHFISMSAMASFDRHVAV